MPVWLVDWSIVCRVPAPLPIKATGTDQAADAGPDPVDDPVKELESICTIRLGQFVELKEALIWLFAAEESELELRNAVRSNFQEFFGVAVYDRPLPVS
jgi:hypothetical protein